MQEINSFGWYNDTVKNSSITTKHLYLILIRVLNSDRIQSWSFRSA